jgi:AcrR family transcriptional regulator
MGLRRRGEGESDQSDPNTSPFLDTLMYINSRATADASRPPRLSRKQSQARTRRRLIDSAARSFARDGVEATTIEAIAEGAGHTRGAFYAHFEGKDELCLAMLEERFDRYLERFDRTLAGDDRPEERARRAGDEMTRLLEADPEWHRLSVEFATYALHNERFRSQLVERYRVLRRGVAEVFRVRAEEFGVTSPIPFNRLAAMTFAMATGVTTGMLLEPDTFGDELHGEMLAIFFAGLRSMAEGSP